MSPRLGILSKPDIRTMWTNEASDFTPWLAREENISRLGEAIGLELEVVGVEVKVGPYSADIKAKSMDDFVIIENQLERTDHSHLGQALTYASGLEAKVIVWVAKQFTDEHRRAVGWLNDMTISDFAFYAVQVELLQIDDSLPAVVFNVVARPNVFRREVLIQDELSTNQQLQWEFWNEFYNSLIESKVVANPRPPRPSKRFAISIGRSGFRLSAVLDILNQRVGMQVYLRSKAAAQAFPLLLNQKEEIEAALGEKLEWGAGSTDHGRTIGLWYNVDISDKSDWKEATIWLVQQVDKFKKAFALRIKNLDLSTSEQDTWNEND